MTAVEALKTLSRFTKAYRVLGSAGDHALAEPTGELVVSPDGEWLKFSEVFAALKALEK